MAKQQLEEVAGVRLYHFGRPAKDASACDHNGVISIASKADYEKKEVLVGFGFCSPLDPFRRSKGRNIAVGRVRKHPIILKFDDNPSKVIKKFLVEVWSAGRHIYENAASNKQLQGMLYNFFMNHPIFDQEYIVSAPFKGLKHFPFAFAWAGDVVFPAEWSE